MTRQVETLTTDLVALLKYNWPQYAVPIRFAIETESPDVEGKLRGWKQAYEMGLKIRAQDVADLIGAAVAKPNEEVLQNPQHVQAAAAQQQMAQQQQQLAQQQAAAQAERKANEDRVIAHFFRGEGRRRIGSVGWEGHAAAMWSDTARTDGRTSQGTRRGSGPREEARQAARKIGRMPCIAQSATSFKRPPGRPRDSKPLNSVL